jgi:hypothetical protein
VTEADIALHPSADEPAPRVERSLATVPRHNGVHVPAPPLHLTRAASDAVAARRPS